jgi:multiple sugar transport system permease protein
MAIESKTEIRPGSARREPSGRTRRGISKLQRREALEGMLMATPWILGFLIFTAGPMLAAIYLGLTKWDICSGLGILDRI